MEFVFFARANENEKKSVFPLDFVGRLKWNNRAQQSITILKYNEQNWSWRGGGGEGPNERSGGYRNTFTNCTQKKKQQKHFIVLGTINSMVCSEERNKHWNGVTYVGRQGKERELKPENEEQ